MRGILSIIPEGGRRFERVPVRVEEIPGKYGRFEVDNSPSVTTVLNLFDREMSERYAGRMVPSFGFDFENKAPEIEKVIFNDPATIVIWKDKTKTVVKCQEGDTYSPELGLAMCIAKKYLGNKGNFNEIFKKWIPEEKPIEIPPKISPEPGISVEEMRGRLQKFCNTRLLCGNCQLNISSTMCGKGYLFTSVNPEELISDEEVKKSYEIVFGNKEAKNEKV